MSNSTASLRPFLFPHLRSDFAQFWAQTRSAVNDGRIADALAIGRLYATRPDSPNIVRYGYGCLLIMAGFEEIGRQVVARVGSFKQGTQTFGTRFFGYDKSAPVATPLLLEVKFSDEQIRLWREKDLLVLSACDSRYFKMFYPKLLGSVKAFCPQAHGIAFLVSDCDETSFVAKAGTADLVLDSVVHTPLAFNASNEPELKVAYSCARWCALANLIGLLREGQKLLVVDVDMFQIREAEHLFSHSHADVNVLLYPEQFMNLVAYVSGSILGLTVGSGSKAFISKVASVVDSCFDQRLVEWHLDQFSLLMGYLESTSTNFSLIDQSCILSEPFESTISESKKQSAVFRSITASIQR
jgi:hypothetical protein